VSSLLQLEADKLLAVPKVFKDLDPLRFSLTTVMNYDRVLVSHDHREEFILTIERGNRKRTRLKYQTRARKIIVLARLDFDGPHHRNPPNSPYRPNERLACPHLHLYREGFDDRVAFIPHEVSGLVLENPADGLACLEGFLRFCKIQSLPPIQTEI